MRRERFSAQRQAALFDVPSGPLEGSLNDTAVIRSVITASIRRCARSREQVADAMTVLTGTTVTKRWLDSVAAPSRADYRFPMELARAFCAATGDNTLLRSLAEMAGFKLIDAAEAELLELGRQYLTQKRSAEQVALLEKRLQGIDLI